MLKKQFLKTKPVCKVTFTFPADRQAEKVFLVGTFNDWNESSHAMKKGKDGSFTLVLELPRDQEFRFRYLVDSEMWMNDEAADRYEMGGYGEHDSVVVTTADDNATAE